jgi:hypothetical protein
VRDYILKMSNVAARLKPFDLAIKDGFLISLIFNSLPKEFETFEMNYNFMNDKWTLKKFIAMCVQEEERIKRNNGGVDSSTWLTTTKRERTSLQSLMLPRKKTKKKL